MFVLFLFFPAAVLVKKRCSLLFPSSSAVPTASLCETYRWCLRKSKIVASRGKILKLITGETKTFSFAGLRRQPAWPQLLHQERIARCTNLSTLLYKWCRKSGSRSLVSHLAVWEVASVERWQPGKSDVFVLRSSCWQHLKS